MSADNCIAILKTPKNDGFEYRVAHQLSVENYEYDEQGNYTADPKIQIKNAREMWSGCNVFTNFDNAMTEADKLNNDVGWTEYGIIFIDINEEF